MTLALAYTPDVARTDVQLAVGKGESERTISSGRRMRAAAKKGRGNQSDRARAAISAAFHAPSFAGRGLAIMGIVLGHVGSSSP